MYWQNEETKLQGIIDSYDDPTYAIGHIKEKKIVKKILLDLPDFFEFVRDNKGLPLKTHITEDFSSIISYLNL